MIYIVPLMTLTDAPRRLIERAYGVYPCTLGLPYWEEKERLGSAFTFVQVKDDANTQEVVYVGIVQVCEGGLHAVVGGGIDGRIDVIEMYNFLVSAAKRLNKDRIRLTGRAGWYRKYLKRLGFTIVEKFTSKQGRLVYVYERGL